MRKKVHLIPVGTLFTSILTVKYVQCVEEPMWVVVVSQCNGTLAAVS